SELSRATGASVSTIRHYIREEILPPPIKTGKTRAHYSEIHLKVIMRIQQERIERKKPLSEIRQILKQEFASELENHIKAGEAPDRREAIITAATGLFLQKGCTDTSIADIADGAHISKETFYIHFRNKEHLFMECADRIFYDMYNHVWQEIREEKDLQERLRKRAEAFFESFPQWISMMNLIRGLAVEENPAFQEKFRQLLRQMIDPLIREVKNLQQTGRFRKEIDSSVAGYLMMGMAEYGASLIQRGTHNSRDVIEGIERLMQRGFL
ncbi:MAG: TetR family transcriptional regulator, partial [Syntrophales bacterium]|nr:TetR family transcriptional regulator [Syntrophales bacterium]